MKLLGRNLLVLFLLLCCVFNLTIGQSTEGCAAAGVTSCCQSDSCQVPANGGNCFCDSSCYATRDCCNDIEFICPHPGISGPGESGDSEDGSGVGPTTQMERAPSIDTLMTNSTIRITKTVTRLFINITHDPGNPRAQLTWEHNGVLISSRTDPRVSILSGGGLTIRNVRASDRGLYTVTVTNRIGNETENFRVLIEFVEINNNTAVAVVDGVITFGCLAKGYPNVQFLTWQTANGENINQTRGILVRQDPHEMIILNTLSGIDRVTCARAGGYRCIYNNGDPMNNVSSALLECPQVPVEVRFERSSYEVKEGSGQVDVCVMAIFRNHPHPVNITVQEVGNTAQVGVDFSLPPSSRSITLHPDSPHVCFAVLINEDLIVENPESFQLNLVPSEENNVNINVSVPSTTISIRDNDFIEILFEESLYQVDESISQPSLHLSLRVCLKQNKSRVISGFDGPAIINVIISTIDGTAQGGSDFIAKRVPRSFSLNGTQEVCECITILPDSLAEGDEFFDIAIFFDDARIISSRSRVRIKDDDEVMISLERTKYITVEGSSPLKVCITATGGQFSSLAVYICTQGITALDAEDYKGLTAQHVIFTDNTSSPHSVRRQCVNVTIIDDMLSEKTEEFSLELQMDPMMHPGTTIGPNSTASVSLLDNDTPGAVFVNGTPLVRGNSITADFIVHGHQSFQIMCTLRGPGRTQPITKNCSSGTVIFPEVTLRYQEFHITIEAIRTDGSKLTLLERAVRLDTDVCWLHLINEGVRMTQDSVTVEWQATGPTAQHKATSFSCWMDHIRTGSSCSSPFIMNGLSPGAHRLIVQPAKTQGCRRLLQRVIDFTI